MQDLKDIEPLLTGDPAAAVKRLRTAAHEGEPQAQLLLGQLLINGVGALRDPCEALRWFRAAAHARVPMAMNVLGRCHEYGLGTGVDYEQAARWYHRAASFECDWAIYNYAHMLANGRGVEKDRATAFLWFKLAAARGHARAMHFLGQYYENGWEIPVDRPTAFAWYRRAAAGGDFRGQCSHASVLAGQGRIAEALHWLRLAAETATPVYLTQLAATLDKSSHPALRTFATTLRAPRPHEVFRPTAQVTLHEPAAPGGGFDKLFDYADQLAHGTTPPLPAPELIRQALREVGAPVQGDTSSPAIATTHVDRARDDARVQR